MTGLHIYNMVIMAGNAGNPLSQHDDNGGKWQDYGLWELFGNSGNSGTDY